MLVREGDKYYFYDSESEYFLEITKRSHYFQSWIELKSKNENHDPGKHFKFKKEHYKIIDNLWLYLNKVGLYETHIIDSIKFNQRYKQQFNYIATKVSYDILDNKHKFLKLYHKRKYFNYHWECFINDYKNVKEFLEDNLFARQMLLSFVTLFGKFNKIYKNKKFRWIVEETPDFYIKGFVLSTWETREKFIEYFRQNLGEKGDFEESWRIHGCHGFCGTDFNAVPKSRFRSYQKCPYDIENIKDCLKFKCPKRKRETLSTNEVYGYKNKTSEIIKLFNNQSCILNIHHIFPKRLRLFIKNDHKIQKLSTHFSELQQEDTIPNMKYCNRIIRNIENYVEGRKNRFPNLMMVLDKILDNLDYIEGERQKLNVKRRIERIKFMII